MQPLRLDRSLIRVSGADTMAFLDNLLTQNVARLSDETVLYAGLLSPQGKVLADMFLWSDSDEDEEAIIIDVDPPRGGDLLKRLTMYKLRAQVSIDDVTDDFPVLFSAEAFPGAVADPRRPAGAAGFRELSPLPPELCHAAADAGEYAAFRIAAAIPDLAIDAAPEEVFALEGLLEELNGVDFQKGCFVGQENVSRMKRRATTRRKFCPLRFEGMAPPFGTPVQAGEAELGSVRSGQGSRALALLRLDRALEAEAKGLTLTAGGVSAKLDPPPWLILPAAGA